MLSFEIKIKQPMWVYWFGVFWMLYTFFYLYNFVAYNDQ